MENYSQLLEKLQERFEKHMQRHRNINWSDILAKIENDPTILKKLDNMENTVGEPDVYLIDGELYFIDSAKESPQFRRSLCYDKEARINRKTRPALLSVEEMAKDLGIELLNEKLYLKIQEIDDLDDKTSSWLKTEEAVRKNGGAIFGDKRYGRTFIYHNGADAYYGSRGFRGYIKL